MSTTNKRLIELFLLFILVPIIMAISSVPIAIKMAMGSAGFVYVIWVLLKVEKKKFKVSKTIKWPEFWKQTLIKFVLIVLITTTYMILVDPINLFVVILNKPMVWVVILFIYSFFSVYPQELIYRTFFFQRYEAIIKSKKLLVYINAIVFALAHLFFRNTLVIFLTFIGGVIFAYTYTKTESTLLVSIEHAIYGCWLFTVGMGNMLGFLS
ncbi:CPBP family intramembrane glutamic endopeptidase [Winogradskyella poriferorum]|uniref:CPBP family intramembrane glutamic endopeptidase n=1 Tax=Winogradskyella poriferorum TaxID=307627 RepID=UPI003D65951C